MSANKAYKKIEVVGTSEESVSDAIEKAIDKAEESVEHLDWFEVDEIRGGLKNENLVYQVSVKIGFRLE